MTDTSRSRSALFRTLGSVAALSIVALAVACASANKQPTATNAQLLAPPADPCVIAREDARLDPRLDVERVPSPVKMEPEPGGPQGQLYNLTKDPTESDNLWLKHPDVVARLTALLHRYQEQGHSR